MQDLNDKTTGSALTAPEFNEIPSELQNVITQLGQSLSSGDLNQLGKGIAGYVAHGNFYTDSGSANVYVLATIGSKQNPPAYVDGFYAQFVADNASTGAACTVNVAGLGVKSIKLFGGADPGAGDISGRVNIAYDAANDWFELLNPKIVGTGRFFSTIASAIAAIDLVNGDVVETIEHTAGRGHRGANRYLVRAVTGASDDGGSVVKLANGTQELVGQFPNGYYPEQWGVHQSDDTVNCDTEWAAAIAYTNTLTTGPGPYQRDQNTQLWDKGAKPGASQIIVTTPVTWDCQSTVFTAGSTLGVASADAVISLGMHVTINGHLAIDCKNNANLNGVDFGWYNPGLALREPCYFCTVNSLQTYNCAQKGANFQSDGNSGVYRNKIVNYYSSFCKWGLHLKTDTGVAKVNTNGFGQVTTLWCDTGVELDTTTGTSFTHLNTEACNTMNLKISDSRGVYIKAGETENVEDIAAITNISDDGSITVLTLEHTVDSNIDLGTYPHFYYTNGDVLRINQTSTALDNAVWTVEQATAPASPGDPYTVKLTASPTGLTGSSGQAFLHPGRCIQVDDNSTGVRICMAIAALEDLDLGADSLTRSIAVEGLVYNHYLGRTFFRNAEFGPLDPVTNLPSAIQDGGISDAISVTGGVKCFPISSGDRNFIFRSPAVTSGNEMGYRFENIGGSRVLLEVSNAGLLTARSDVYYNDGDGSITAQTGAPVSAPATETQLRLRRAGGAETAAYVWSVTGTEWVPVIQPATITHNDPAGDAVTQSIFTATRACRVLRVIETHSTAETTAATLYLQLSHDTGTDAPAAGTDLINSNGGLGLDLKAAANTPQAASLISALDLAAGERLAVEFSTAATELAGVQVTIDILWL